MLHKKYHKRPLPFGAPYSAFRINVNKMLEAAKDYFYGCTLKSTAVDPKGTWKMLNKIFGKPVSSSIVIEHLNIKNIIVNDPNIISIYINRYFSNTGRESGRNIPACDASPPDFFSGSF